MCSETSNRLEEEKVDLTKQENMKEALKVLRNKLPEYSSDGAEYGRSVHFGHGIVGVTYSDGHGQDSVSAEIKVDVEKYERETAMAIRESIVGELGSCRAELANMDEPAWDSADYHQAMLIVLVVFFTDCIDMLDEWRIYTMTEYSTEKGKPAFSITFAKTVDSAYTYDNVREVTEFKTKELPYNKKMHSQTHEIMHRLLCRIADGIDSGEESAVVLYLATGGKNEKKRKDVTEQAC
jgi:hypothetical protein